MILKRRLAFLAMCEEAVNQYDDIVKRLQDFVSGEGRREVAITVSTEDLNVTRHLVLMLHEEKLLDGNEYFYKIDKLMENRLFCALGSYMDFLELRLKF